MSGAGSAVPSEPPILEEPLGAGGRACPLISEEPHTRLPMDRGLGVPGGRQRQRHTALRAPACWDCPELPRAALMVGWPGPGEGVALPRQHEWSVCPGHSSEDALP